MDGVLIRGKPELILLPDNPLAADSLSDKCREQGLSPPISLLGTQHRFLDARILLAHNLPWVFVFSKRDKPGMTKMIGRRPFRIFDCRYQFRL